MVALPAESLRLHRFEDSLAERLRNSGFVAVSRPGQLGLRG